MLCVYDNAGFIKPVSPPPADLTTCPYVLLSGGEYQPSPFALDNASALAIGGSIFLVWAVAFGFRVAARALNSGDPIFHEE